MLTTYRALIADDEPLLRRRLCTLLADVWPELEIVAVAADGDEAWQQIRDKAPDVAFLDIRMPGQDGLSLAKRFDELEHPPLVVFATAFDQHAVGAFENEAVDYLLKPIEEERLAKAVQRVRQRLVARHAGENVNDAQHLHRLLAQLLSATGGEGESLKWIRASRRDSVHVLSVEDIDYFLAESKYTTVRSQKNDYLIRTSIVQLERKLDPNAFWRIHRGCIVRVDQVARVERNFSGRLFVVLKDSKGRLPVSRSYQEKFRQM